MVQTINVCTIARRSLRQKDHQIRFGKMEWKKMSNLFDYMTISNKFQF